MAADDPEIGYERSDVSPRLAAALALGVVALVVIVVLALRFVYPQALDDRGGKGPRKPLSTEPRLQVDPAADLLSMRHAEEARLTGYGWVDPAAGRVRIPIEEAMRLTAERGAGGWPAPARPQ